MLSSSNFDLSKDSRVDQDSTFNFYYYATTSLPLGYQGFWRTSTEFRQKLALGDALTAFTICEYDKDGGGDIEAVWLRDLDEAGIDERCDEGDCESIRDATQYMCALVILRCLKALSADSNAIGLWERAVRTLSEEHDNDDVRRWIKSDSDVTFSLFECDDDAVECGNRSGAFSMGACRREVYPWNDFEGDRMSDEALAEINGQLNFASEGMIEARKSLLPDLTAAAAAAANPGNCDPAPGAAALSKADRILEPTSTSNNYITTTAQLGLFAVKDLPPGTTVLTERSPLTAIRPHGASLCDACAGDLNSDNTKTSAESCPGCDIPFCSPECLSIAESYHKPNLDDASTDDGYPPASSPFCSGSHSETTDAANLGRAESSTTPEWDLYFLLIIRALQMAETQDRHPLELFECKYLWGDFNEDHAPKHLDTSDSPPTRGPALRKTLPYSLTHHTSLPLQWFELLMLSRPDSFTPYSRKWLQCYDWWVIQTLYAKFRGVADAKLSTWSGEPETASVYPLWCLANHSCEPGVTWEGGGVRRLRVREEKVVAAGDEATDAQWIGVKKDEEVWNHYTDVREKDYRVRRSRLREVLGGDCCCSRCLREEAAAKVNGH
ncbi:uncharacterized protein AB675_6915 [Cyphellophora attinorum]|uniref:SET domain-containing protein n=1 Tax=Cyphellophora attinorum TaxID=1664694 RepID=A0A0N1P0X7_9EURO|nr:uncharacterized protein AB675_6915 [Phialophora attinorum]KPI43483.1 hypothetical protein AB675_6915 [Phialophora attinorum]